MLGGQNLNNRLTSTVHEKLVDKAFGHLSDCGLTDSLKVFEEYILLCAALKYNYKIIIKKLLIKGSDVNSKNGDPCNTPLHFAVKSCDIEVVEMLLNKGANINARNECDRTPLYNAIESKKIEIIELLLAHSANVNIKDKFNISPLHCATEIGCLQIIEHILKHGACINHVCTLSGKEGYTPLHLAATNGNTEIITLLLSKGADINAKGEDSKTPLYIASEQGYQDAVELFLNNGANINPDTIDDLTPIHIAIKKGHISIVKLLLQHGIDVDNENKHGETILNLAVQKGFISIIQEILKYCPDINNQSNRNSINIAVHGSGEMYKKIVEDLLEYGFCINPADANKSSLLYAAIKNGYYKIVESLLRYGADANFLHISIFQGGLSPLHIAVINDQEEIGKLLISYGANVNTPDSSGKTPIYYATKNANLKFIELLLTNRSNIKNNNELLLIAVKNLSIEIVEVLINYGADINAIDQYGRSGLHFTAINEIKGSPVYFTYEDPEVNIKAEIARLLLRKGANVNAQTKSGLTALHAAIESGYMKVVEVLLEYNADIHVCDENGNTALHFTVLANNKDDFKYNSFEDDIMTMKAGIVKLLLSKGANVNAQNNRGLTILQAATQRAFVKVVEVLLQYDADINLCNINGKTALHFIALNENEELLRFFSIEYGDIDVHTEIAVMLLTKGANVDAQTRTGLTALHAAAHKGFKKIVEILLQYNANVNCRTNDGLTPLHLASQKGFLEIIDIILKFNANINSIDVNGKTALHYASKRNHVKTVTTLLEHGCDINIATIENKTPLDYTINGTRIFNYEYNAGIDNNVYSGVHYCAASAKALRHHIVKLKTINHYVSKKNLLSIKNIAEIDYFQEQCEKEIARARSEKINNTNISIYDILTGDTNSLTKYLNNDNILQMLTSENYKLKFPIYANIIKLNFKKSMYRRELLEKKKEIYYLFLYISPKFPYDCIEKIFSYLCDEELTNLINSSNLITVNSIS